MGVLDTTAASAYLAYGLRKLRTAYAGPAIRVRRASDNAEQDIGFSGNDLDWASANSFKGASTLFVRTWYDQTGNARHATQTTAGDQPLLNTSEQSVEFGNGGVKFINLPDLSSLSAGEAFFYRKLDSDPPANGEGGTWSLGSDATASHIPYSDGTIYDAFGTTARKTTSVNPTPSMASYHVYSAYSVTNDWADHLDAALLYSTGTNTVGFAAAPFIGKSGIYYMVGHGRAFVLLSAQASSGDRIILGTYSNYDADPPPSITTTSLPNGVAGVGYSQTLGVTGGTGSITWSITVGALPDGLSLNSSTGEISGTPTTLGTFNFTVEAEDTVFATDTQALSITIEATPPIIGTDGEQYHKFAVEASVKEHDDSIRFATLRNDLQDGFRSQSLVGINTGTRQFRLTLPTLTGGTLLPSVVGVNGETVSRERYLWGLYCEFQRTGKPFVIENFRNGQYYLVDFTNPELSYRRFQALFYSTGVELKQTRIDNVSIFQPTLIEKTWMFWDSDTAFATNNWNGVDEAGTTTVFVKTGDVIDVASGQNGHQIKRFNLTTNNGFIETGLGAMIYDVVIPVRFREPTFSNDADVFSNSPDGAYIKGDSGTTKFTDPSLANFFYSLNGTEYAADNMQAPMNEWGVCHFRNRDGWDVGDGMRIGLASGGAAPEMDIGDVFVSKELQPMEDMLELIEHLVIKFATG